ncbi:zinc finger HIT domain-containing protein 3 [Melitaea cinxia]|uniref:zinc finger HIT domain-containing protein 3 n=1 Tax=Melitaea cinxia TaxID=113334 RepID=UPI001E272D5E|nr:zinc finger HIT domain-containing protein 3 [Melitaea cinxia]
MDCIECGKDSKYKCPICRQPYCSVACCKLHKKTPCSLPPQPQIDNKEESPMTDDFPTEDTVPSEKLKQLEQSTELRNCLKNPHVRKILEILDSSAHPDLLISEYMQEPIFTEFVDACLNVVQDNRNDG